MSKNVVEINDKNWDSEVMQSEVPVIVDFWAEWCGPCKMLSPVLESFAEEMAGKIKVAKVNCESNMDLAKSYGVRNIPAVFLIKGGKVVNKSVGAMNKVGLQKFASVT